jgi:hypothetical protein
MKNLSFLLKLLPLTSLIFLGNCMYKLSSLKNDASEIITMATIAFTFTAVAIVCSLFLFYNRYYKSPKLTMSKMSVKVILVLWSFVLLLILAIVFMMLRRII